MKKILIALSLIFGINLYATNYYEMAKIEKQAKSMPYMKTKSEKERMFTSIEKRISKMKEKDQKIIRPKIKEIYKRNREIENEMLQNEMHLTVKNSSKKVSDKYRKIKKQREKQEIW